MKKSLKQAINIFPYKHRIILIFELICRKFGSTIGKKGDLILARCEQYVQLIEKGVFIQRKTHGLLKMKYLVNEKEYSFFIREKSSDIRVFESVILLEEYKIAKEQLSRQDNGQNVIIDAGANIGFTTIYFHAFFENARFVLVEPDPDNCKMLKNNLLINNINNVSILQNALWINEDQLILDDSFRDGMEWSLSIQVKEDHLMNSLQRLTKVLRLIQLVKS
jgi:FkbM family methyltransferase